MWPFIPDIQNSHLDFYLVMVPGAPLMFLDSDSAIHQVGGLTNVEPFQIRCNLNHRFT